MNKQTKMNRKIALFTLVLTLGLINYSILKKEQHLASGQQVFLKLAPVDPRSLMQGDYMALNFTLSEQIYQALPKSQKSRRWRQDIQSSDGFVVVTLDEKQRASYVRIHQQEALSPGELLLSYRIRHGEVKFATNGFFFQEGHGKAYEAAKFGAFRVNEDAELLLVSMHDAELKPITSIHH